MNRLKDKRALITGGTSGIGLESARQFLNEGARVAITGKNPANLEAAEKELGRDVLIIASDASDVAAQKAVAESIRQEFGGLDILFVNAGITELRPVEQWDEAAFDRSFAINVKGPYFLIQALLPPNFRESRVYCSQCVSERAYRHAKHNRLRRHKGCSPIPYPYTLWRTDLAWHSCKCSQPGSDRDSTLQQTRPFRSQSQGGLCFHPKPGSCRALRKSQ
jgi:NAD(P)-dependent dehydrogenase (short-subunit alcohol dehydrogenase family)